MMALQAEVWENACLSLYLSNSSDQIAWKKYPLILLRIALYRSRIADLSSPLFLQILPSSSVG